MAIREERTTILFWNTKRNPVAQSITRLAGFYDADIVLLAESDYWTNPDSLLSTLNVPPVSSQTRFVHISSRPKVKDEPPVQVFSRLQKSRWRVVKEQNRYTIWNVKTKSGNTLLLAVVHFPNVRDEQGDEQRKTAVELRQDISQIERYYTAQSPKEKGYAGAPFLVIGDLNANPFDAGVAGIYGLNATQRRRVAQEGMRELDGRCYPFFYNPMWQFFGKRQGNAPGTYYRRLSRPICYDWFILDQVLVRPSLLTKFEDSDVHVPTSDGLVPLVSGSDSRPRTMISDHLPLVIRLRY